MNKLMKSMNSSLINLPTPINISYWWNYGSLLGLFLSTQFISGTILSIHYCPNISLAFESIIHINQNVNQGWLIHKCHINGASFFFICMYLHIGRGIYYQSFNLYYTWFIGVSILLTSMATAFLGYVLPWGQMSYWGATVITNLVTTIPFIGSMMVEWIWGGFSINNATLNRFFSFHFIIPFIMTTMVFVHLMFLHETGSKNPLGTSSNFHKISFHSYFTIKDFLGFSMIFIGFMTINLQYPFMFGDPDNFTQANPMITPTHIQPEWYFLFAYAILRSIPNKLGGVLALTFSILILYTLPWSKNYMKSNKFYPPNQILFWIFSANFITLTFLGAQPIEYPYMTMSQVMSILHFSFFITNEMLFKLWDKITSST